MLIHYDPDEHKTVVEHRTCPFHQVHPRETYAGCTCSSSWSSVPRSREEIMEIKAKRRREEEDRILAQAEIIKANRAGVVAPTKRAQETQGR